MRFTNVNLLQGLLSDNCSNYVTLNCFKTAHTLLNRTKKNDTRSQKYNIDGFGVRRDFSKSSRHAVGKSKKEGRLY